MTRQRWCCLDELGRVTDPGGAAACWAVSDLETFRSNGRKHSGCHSLGSRSAIYGSTTAGVVERLYGIDEETLQPTLYVLRHWGRRAIWDQIEISELPSASVENFDSTTLGSRDVDA